MSRANDVWAEMYRRMLRIRQFEAMAGELHARGEIPGGLHTATGQEGAIVGACMALDVGDYMVGTHRSHGHPIGKGAKLDRLMAELLARETGVNKGKGGSMHLADFSVGSLGETSILGSGPPVAVGAALGAKLQKSGRVSLCFFGDGASNEGAVHEAMNLAGAWKLPVVFVCENNGYAITTSIRSTCAVQDLCIRAAGYGMPGESVDGQNVLAVFDVVQAAVRRARAGEGPSMVEAKTYRFAEHALGLPPMAYRPADEVEAWRARDPISLFEARLVSEGVLDAAAVKAIEVEVEAEVRAAADFALASPKPAPDAAYEDVFAAPLVDLRG
jgi:pyruvate dehydrogenase E1 component alpha subunit